MSRSAFSDLDPDDLDLVQFSSIGYMGDASAGIAGLASATQAIVHLACFNVQNSSAAYLERSQERLWLANREINHSFASKSSVVSLVRLFSAWGIDVRLGLVEAFAAYVSVCEDSNSFAKVSGSVLRDISGSRCIIGTPVKGELRIAFKRALAYGLNHIVPGYKDAGERAVNFLISLEHEAVLDSFLNLGESEVSSLGTALFAEASDVQRFFKVIQEAITGFLLERKSMASC